jgi:hypothetical protein
MTATSNKREVGSRDGEITLSAAKDSMKIDEFFMMTGITEACSSRKVSMK